MVVIEIRLPTFLSWELLPIPIYGGETFKKKVRVLFSKHIRIMTSLWYQRSQGNRFWTGLHFMICVQNFVNINFKDKWDTGNDNKIKLNQLKSYQLQVKIQMKPKSNQNQIQIQSAPTPNEIKSNQVKSNYMTYMTWHDITLPNLNVFLRKPSVRVSPTLRLPRSIVRITLIQVWFLLKNKVSLSPAKWY